MIATEQEPRAEERPGAEDTWGSTNQPVPVLRRSRDDRMLFGVCGGLARYLGVDPVLVRAGFVLLAVFGGSGVVLYLLGLILIPAEIPGETVGPGGAAAGGSAVILGAVLVAVGAVLLATRLLPGLGDLLAPLVILTLGVVVILASRR